MFASAAPILAAEEESCVSTKDEVDMVIKKPLTIFAKHSILDV